MNLVTLPRAMRGASLSFAVALALSTSSAGAQNLLNNPGFESGLQDWTVLAGTIQDLSYGAASAPSILVANTIGGGNRHIRGSQSGSVIEQTVVTGPVASGTNLEASGYFGGFSTDAASGRLVIRFLDNNGNEIALRSLKPVSVAQRNSEDVLMLRRGLFEVPSGTEQVVARIEFTDTGGATNASADEIFLGFTTEPLIPPPLPLNSELIINGGFEDGYGPGSPLTLVDLSGWEGTGSRSLVEPYDDNDATVPDVVVAALIGGAANVLSDVGSSSGLAQILDVRGNAAQIGSGLSLRISAYLGGVTTNTDTAEVEVLFLDENMTRVGFPVPTVGPVTAATRNLQTVVMKMEQLHEVPQGTAFIRVTVVLENPSGAPFALVDNVSAELLQPAPVAPQPLGVNVLANGSFEAGSIAGSPLQLNNTAGWVGIQPSTSVPSYGPGSSVPDTTFSLANGLGGLLLADLGDGGVRQVINLRGMTSLVDQGGLLVEATCWLGGIGSNSDTGLCNLRFKNEFGVQVGVLHTLGPVTAADRNNLTTLLERNDMFVAPIGAVELEVNVVFMNPSGGPAALADGVEVILIDNTSIGGNYCSTNQNSTGQAGEMMATGSATAADNNVTLIARNLPSLEFGFFLTSLTQGFVANPGGSQGNLCLAGDLGRYNMPVLQSNASGILAQAIDLTMTPTGAGPTSILAGETWNFQAWHRDLNPGPVSNLTDGLSILFE